MFIHKSGNQALVFRRLSKLTDAVYPITFLDVLAFRGSYFRARILQAGRTLVGLLETNVTAPLSLFYLPCHPGLSSPSVPAYYGITRSSLLNSRGHLSTYFTLSLFFLPPRPFCKPCAPTTSVLTPKIHSGPLPLPSESAALNSSLHV